MVWRWATHGVSFSCVCSSLFRVRIAYEIKYIGQRREEDDDDDDDGGGSEKGCVRMSGKETRTREECAG